MKLTKHFVLAAVLTTGFALNAPRSEAIIGVGSLVTGHVVIGVICTGLGARALLSTPKGDFDVLSKFAFGMFFLDKNSGEIEMKAISHKEAINIGLTDAEEIAYNSELDRINAGLAEMNSTLSNAGENISQEKRNSALEEFKSNISEEAFTATQKILSSALDVNL